MDGYFLTAATEHAFEWAGPSRVLAEAAAMRRKPGAPQIVVNLAVPGAEVPRVPVVLCVISRPAPPQPAISRGSSYGSLCGLNGFSPLAEAGFSQQRPYKIEFKPPMFPAESESAEEYDARVRQELTAAIDAAPMSSQPVLKRMIRVFTWRRPFSQIDS